MERAWTFDGAAAKESEENKENLRVSSDPDGDLLLCQDEEALNDSVISGERGPGRAGRGACTRGWPAGVVQRAQGAQQETPSGRVLSFSRAFGSHAAQRGSRRCRCSA